MNTKRYTVRLGDDGRAKYATDDLADAMSWAADYAATNWAGKAQVRCDGTTIARWTDGEQVTR
jgi:hypothetical protein